jgi:hypothetical protein
MSRLADPTEDRRLIAIAARIALVLMVALMLVGCGKKGNPVPPPGEPNTYPKPYPRD